MYHHVFDAKIKLMKVNSRIAEFKDTNCLSIISSLNNVLPSPPPSSPAGCFRSLHLWVTPARLCEVSGSEVLM